MKPEYKEKAQEVASKVGEKLNHAFTEHPKATGETYLQHLWFTIRMAGRMFWAGIAITTHGILPFTFTKTGSNEIMALYSIMKNRIPASKLLESYEQYHGSHI